jgi:hypothetical protein
MIFCTALFKSYHQDSNGKNIVQFATQNYGLPIFRPILIKKTNAILLSSIVSKIANYHYQVKTEKKLFEMHKLNIFFRRKSNSGYVVSATYFINAQ